MNKLGIAHPDLNAHKLSMSYNASYLNLIWIFKKSEANGVKLISKCVQRLENVMVVKNYYKIFGRDI